MFIKKNAFIVATTTALLAAGTASAEISSFKVNGETVTKAEQEQLIRIYTERGAARTPQLEGQVRTLLTRDKILLQEARKQKIAERDDVKRLIDNSTKNILMSSVINVWLEKNPVSDDDVKALFESEKKRWGNTEVQVRHILVKDEKEANNLIRRIRKGEDFAKLAAENSIDTQQNRAAGGLIEWNSPNLFDTEFADGFKNLKPGQLAAKPVKTHLGWHVIKLEGRRTAKRYSNFNADAPVLRQLLTQQRAQSYVDSLLKDAKLTDISGKSLKR